MSTIRIPARNRDGSYPRRQRKLAEVEPMPAMPVTKSESPRDEEMAEVRSRVQSLYATTNIAEVMETAFAVDEGALPPDERIECDFSQPFRPLSQ